MQKLKGPKKKRIIFYTILDAVIYQIWRIRNEKFFSKHQRTAQDKFKHTKDHITKRTLILSRISGKYNKCIDRLIG